MSTYDIEDPKHRKRFLAICNNKLSKFYDEDKVSLEKYNIIGEYLSKVSHCCTSVANSYELDELLEIKVRAYQLGITDIIDREELKTIEDLVEYANEIDWSSSKSDYITITNLIGDMCIYLNEADELLNESENHRRIQSLEEFKEELLGMLNNLMNTRYDLTPNDIDYISRLSKEQKVEFINEFLHGIESLDNKISNMIIDIIDVKVHINKYL